VRDWTAADNSAICTCAGSPLSIAIFKSTATLIGVFSSRGAYDKEDAILEVAEYLFPDWG
jgi:hypothetical protein